VEGSASEFELLTGLAIWWLAPRTDRLVIEVGLGGRLDATNVVDPGVAVITNVELDHQRVLGAAIEQIASEKAGIIKPGNLVVTGAEGAALAVIERRARDLGCELWRLGQEIEWSWEWRGWTGTTLSVAGPGFAYRNLSISLLGSWQPANAALAVAAAHALGDASENAVRQGLVGARWPGRLQAVEPNLLFDGGHNPAGLRAVLPDVRRLAGARPVVVVLGTMADKDVPAMVAELRRLQPQAVVCTAAASAGQRAIAADQLAGIWGAGAEALTPAAAALERAQALAAKDALVLVCGSLYLVGELLP
jgi:dihydrofolate synthase / folylpolyglutamate synthase